MSIYLTLFQTLNNFKLIYPAFSYKLNHKSIRPNGLEDFSCIFGIKLLLTLMACSGRSSIMEIIKIKNPLKISKTIIDKLSRTLIEEKTIILPTNTIYGLSCRFDSKPAIENIYRIKRRKKELPFIILISSTESLESLADSVSPEAEALIEKYWNLERLQSLTIIFKKKKALEGFITGGSPNIAIRIAGLGFVRQLIDICGPIVSTSATISGSKDSPVEIKDIPRSIGRRPFREAKTTRHKLDRRVRRQHPRPRTNVPTNKQNCCR